MVGAAAPLLEPNTPTWAQRFALRLQQAYVPLYPTSPQRIFEVDTVGELPPAAAWPDCVVLVSGVLYTSNGSAWVPATGVPATTAPTAPQFDNSTLIANTAWVNRVGLQFSSRLILSGATTLTASAAGSLVIVTAAAAVTLPLASSFPSGTTISFFSQATGVTVQRTGSDNINTGPTFVSSLTLNIGDTLELVSNGLSAWLANGGSAQLSYSNALANNWPLAPQFDNSGKLATTQFVNRVGLQYSGDFILSANTTLTAAHAGARIQISGGVTMTLPPASSFPTGATISFWSSGPPINTIKAAGSDALYIGSGTSLTPLPMASGDTLVLESLGSLNAWIAVGGSVQLPYAAAFKGPGWTTAPQFDNTTTLATTAFVNRVGKQYTKAQGYGASTTLTPAQAGQYAPLFTAGITMTLPAANSVPSGATITFQNATTGSVTISRAGADTLFNPITGNVATYALPNPKSVQTISDGVSAWFLSGTGF